MPQDTTPPRPRRNKPRLIPTITAYNAILFGILAVMGLLFANTFTQISSIATDTRDNVLPAIIERQRTAVNLERLGRFAETVYRADDSKRRRQFKLAAHILSQDAVFEADANVSRQVLDAYLHIAEIAELREQQETDQAASSRLFLSFAPGTPNAKSLLSLKNGTTLTAIVLKASQIQGISALKTLTTQLDRLAPQSSMNTRQQTAINEAKAYLEQRQHSLLTDAHCEKLWKEADLALTMLADNLTVNAAAKADIRFTQIKTAANQAIHTGWIATLALTTALIILIYLTQRDLVAPIIQYVRGLDQIAQGEKELDLPPSRIKEMDDIRAAVERSAQLMTQLGQQTKEMKLANDTLEEEIAVREKTQQELALSKERAEAADRAKGDFLAGMSHEIRTPMNTIMGMADLMLETELTQAQRQYIEVFQSSGALLLSIINDVLDLSKIEAGEIELESVPIDIDQFIAQTTEFIDSRARQKGLDLVINVDENIPAHIKGDPVRLKQVLVNLLDNAVKFTDSGSVTLSIRKARDGEPGTITFAIIDTGIGIPPETQQHIFQRFTQADTSTTRKYGGTGLGLAICHRLVELMGSTIQLESSPRRGSTFFFTINFSIPDHATETTSSEPITQAALTQALSENPARILIAEDSDSNQALMELYFSKTGCPLDFAADGAEALQKFKKNRYDLVLMDIQMPIMDGYEATTLIRQHELEHGTSPTPIIAVTANAFKEDQRRCLAAGCTDYLPKPISKISLLQCVAHYIGVNLTSAS